MLEVGYAFTRAGLAFVRVGIPLVLIEIVEVNEGPVHPLEVEHLNLLDALLRDDSGKPLHY